MTRQTAATLIVTFRLRWPPSHAPECHNASSSLAECLPGNLPRPDRSKWSCSMDPDRRSHLRTTEYFAPARSAFCLTRHAQRCLSGQREIQEGYAPIQPEV